jgi:hypothetical protein
MMVETAKREEPARVNLLARDIVTKDADSQSVLKRKEHFNGRNS